MKLPCTRSARRFALGIIFAFILPACAPLYTHDPQLAAPRPKEQWSGLIADVRTFQRRIGFTPTPNFQREDQSREGYSFCGHGSPMYLPYSYQDPAIRWVDAQTEEDCRAAARDADASFATTEAMAGRATPVTARMLTAPLARFLYVVMHEDCHEQFRLPSGIEEALCNALAYAGMEAFGRDRFADAPDERNEIERFVRAGAARAEFTRNLYEELSALYARHAASEISPETLLAERGELFRTAARRLARPEAAVNNVWLAKMITYSRHYALMQRVLDVYDGDLEKAVAYFRRVDSAKPERASVAAAQQVASEQSVEFVRAYEAVIVKIIERSLETGEMLRAGVE